MFRLSRRKGSAMWQVRKRWPSDVAAILKGEFTRSTGEEDRKKAQALLVSIAAEYEARVQEARDRLADNRFRNLSESEIARLTAQFYRAALPSYRLTRTIPATDAHALLANAKDTVAQLEASQARRDYWPVDAISKTVIAQEGLPIGVSNVDCWPSLYSSSMKPNEPWAKAVTFTPGGHPYRACSADTVTADPCAGFILDATESTDNSETTEQ